MTGAEFSGVDFDLLADYVGGALTGTPDEATVAALIADDPAWRVAHDELAGAMASVGAELNALGAVAEPMPPELAGRLDAAFGSAVSDPAPIDPELAAPAVPFVVTSGAGAASGRHLSAVPDDGVDLWVDEPRRVTGGGRRRRLRWAAPIAAAAGVIAFVGFGVSYLNDRSQMSSDSAASSGVGTSQKQAEADAPMAAQNSNVLGDRVITASGLDYQLSTLASASTQLKALANKQQSDPGSGGPAAPAASPPLAISSAAPLARLRPAEALSACLDAIVRDNAAGPITAPIVDFARYAGSPAVIVRFTAANGEWVWAAGPDCGLQPSGAAKLASVKVG